MPGAVQRSSFSARATFACFGSAGPAHRSPATFVLQRPEVDGLPGAVDCARCEPPWQQVRMVAVAVRRRYAGTRRSGAVTVRLVLVRGADWCGSAVAVRAGHD